MSFWTYMLHCRGGYFYVGHTDELERRVGEHKSGSVPGFTADHQPVEFVWSQEFPTRDEAKAAERRIKGWSRAKKLALIRGDWEQVSALSRNKGSASTSSAQTGKDNSIQTPISDRPELVEGLSFPLLPHPQTPPSKVQRVSAKLRISDGLAWLSYTVTPGGSLKLPAPAAPVRKDGLWQTTCFELFVRPDGEGYREFNFSASGAWAAYRFDSYREGMANLAMPARPDISVLQSEGAVEVTASFAARLLGPEPALALSSVIEELDGTKSYWALAHPPGQPDFHHPACFAATLPAPEQS